MKMKKVFLSLAIVLMATLLLIGGVSGTVKKKPIEVREMAMTQAQVIEYEEGENNANSTDENSKENVLDDFVMDKDYLLSEKKQNDLKDKKTSTDFENSKIALKNNLKMVSGEKVEVDDVTICVFGNAKLSLSPDSAKISACIQFLESELDKAKENNFQAFENLIKALKKIGIEEDAITLTHFNCHPNYNYDCGRKIVGYYSTTSFTIKVDALDKIKECVSVMTANGVTEINDIVYEVSNLDEQYSNALKNAVENSKEKASKLLNRNDLKIVSVKEEHVYSCNSLYRTYAGDMSASDLVGKIEVEARVLVEFK